MALKEWAELLAVFLSAASVVIAIFAFRRANSAERRSLAEAKTQAFITFRNRFIEIKHNLPPRWGDKEWLPQPDTEEWRPFEAYWQNAFDEWYVPMCLNREYLEDVWRLFFESAVKSALPYRPLRYVAWRLCEAGEFGQYNEEFAEVLEKLWGKPLKDSDFVFNFNPAEPCSCSGSQKSRAR